MAAYEVAVVGLGVMGSAALASLARRGRRVVGIDRLAPGHDRGSSHGATRVIRLGYFEHPAYVPLLRAAYPLWRALEARSGTPLLTVTGILEIGDPASELVAGTLAASRQHGLAHEVLDAPALMRRFPALRVPDNFVGVFQPDGGFVRAEATVTALIAQARAAGAELRIGERVLAVEPQGGGVRVVTESGAIAAGRVIVAAGSRVRSLIPDLPVRPIRQVLLWFEPRDDAALLAPGRLPVFMLQRPDGLFYGFPADGRAGVKAAEHAQSGETVDPDDYPRAVTAADEAPVRAVLEAHLPGAAGHLLAATTCLYTMAPDGDFIIDHVPDLPGVIVASPCSGHGFKFAPLIGEILADLATTGTTAHDIARFALSRFS
jgi:sarcosine oxidase